jgi:hypothetical protein
MRWPNLTLFAGGAPALLADRWLLRITANKPRAFNTTHQLDIRLEPSVPPVVPVDFLWVVWRMQSGGVTALTHYAAQMATGTEAGPGSVRVAEYSLFHADATWHTRAGRQRRGVHFQLEVTPVWRPTPKD